MQGLIRGIVVFDLIDDRELARLSSLYRHGIPDERLRTLCTGIVEHLARRTQAPLAWIELVDARQVHCLAQFGLDDQESRRRDALGDAVVDRAAHLLVSDSQGDRLYADDLAVVGPPHIRAYAGAPVRSDKEVIGLIAIADTQARHFGSDAEAALVEACGKLNGALDTQGRERRDRHTDALDRAAFKQQVERMGALVGHGLDALSLAVLDIEPLYARLQRIEPALGRLLFEYIAGLGREQVRRRDALGRLGPYTFGVLLARTGEAGAQVMAHRMTERLVAEWSGLMPSDIGSSLVEVGVTTWQGRTDSPHAFVARAEDALRSAVLADPTIVTAKVA